MTDLGVASIVGVPITIIFVALWAVGMWFRWRLHWVWLWGTCAVVSLVGATVFASLAEVVVRYAGLGLAATFSLIVDLVHIAVQAVHNVR